MSFARRVPRVSRTSVLCLSALCFTALCAWGCQPAPRTAAEPPQPPPIVAPQAFGIEFANNQATVTTNRGFVRVTRPDKAVFRVQLSRDATFDHLPSFAVEPALQERRLVLESTAEPNGAVLWGDGTGLRVTHDGTLELLDSERRVVGRGGIEPRTTAGHPVLTWLLSEGVGVFGLGDKTKGQNRRGKAFELWNTDSYGWEPDTDPLYKSFPVFLLIGPGSDHGLFIDSAARAVVDVGAKNPDQLRYELDTQHADDLDIYLFAGARPAELTSSLTNLTGRMPLPPRWTLGYHQSRYGYKTEKEVRDVVTRLRKDHIPLDVIWLDIDYQDHNVPFTVNASAFPTFAGMIADFARTFTRTVVITDMHIHHKASRTSGYVPYDSGREGDHFILAPGSEQPFIAPVWPGPSVFPEFTREKTRAWWGQLYSQFLDQGVSGFWNDMNEPATFTDSKTFPPQVEHRLDDGRRVPHVLVHNAYGTLNARATYEGVRKLRPGTRPFVLTRAASPGVQRYAASWTGDNRATWAHLKATIAQLGNLGVSGLSFVGADVGGFVGCPEPELLASWMSLGAFQPFFRNHAAHDACAREPWVHGEKWEAVMRAAVERRYRLIPYLYTVFEESARTGQPILRPLWFEFADDPSLFDADTAFLVGPDLLVAPRLESGEAPWKVRLPAVAWYDTSSGQLYPTGGEVTLSGAEPVVFARAGSIVPQMPLVQQLSQPAPGQLILDVWSGPDCHGSVYWDDGESFGYEQGNYRRVALSCEVTEQGLTVTAHSTGSFKPFWTSVHVRLHGGPSTLGKARDEGGRVLAVKKDPEHQLVEFDLPGARTDFQITVGR